MDLYYQPVYQEDLEKAYNGAVGIDKLKDSSIIITGSRGMIGSFITDLLVYCNKEKGFRCKIYAAGRDIRKISERFSQNVGSSGLRSLFYDLESPITWDIKADYIIHAAGNAYPDSFMPDPAGTLWGSVNGTYNLLNYSVNSGLKRFLFVSSGEVYGQAEPALDWFEEKYGGYIDSLDPRSCYPIAKRACENLCACLKSQSRLNAVIARPCHVYGPTATPEDGRIASVCLRKALRGEDIVLKSDGMQRRSYCYIADCASGILTALLNGEPGEAYNIASGSEYTTIKKFAETVAEVAGNRVVYSVPEPGEKKSFNPMDMAVLSAEKMKQLGWQEQFSLESGIRHTLEALKGAQQRMKRDDSMRRDV